MKIELFPYARPKGDNVLFLVSLRKVGSVTWVSPKDKDHPFDCVEEERSNHFLSVFIEDGNSFRGVPRRMHIPLGIPRKDDMAIYFSVSRKDGLVILFSVSKKDVHSL